MRDGEKKQQQKNETNKQKRFQKLAVDMCKLSLCIYWSYRVQQSQSCHAPLYKKKTNKKQNTV